MNGKKARLFRQYMPHNNIELKKGKLNIFRELKRKYNEMSKARKRHATLFMQETIESSQFWIESVGEAE